MLMIRNLFSVFLVKAFLVIWLMLPVALSAAPYKAFLKTKSEDSESSQQLSQPEKTMSDWQTKGPVKARLFLTTLNDTQLVAALELKMDSGWHTYWKYPGASGIRPNFDWTGSVNFKPLMPMFEAPMRFSDPAGDYFGYQKTTIISLPIKPLVQKDKISIKLAVDIGVCRDICLPAHFDFTLVASQQAFALEENKRLLAGLLTESLKRYAKAADETLQVGSLSFDGVALNMVIIGADLKNPDIIIAGGALDTFERPDVLGRDRLAFLVSIPARAGGGASFIGREVEVILRDGKKIIRQMVRVTKP